MLSELLVLSAGAVKPGLEKVIAAFERTHAARVRARHRDHTRPP